MPPLGNRIVRAWETVVSVYGHGMVVFVGCGRAGADVGRTYCSWSRTPRTRLHAGAHAAEACWCQTPELRHERSTCSQNVTVEDATGAPDPPFCIPDAARCRGSSGAQNPAFCRGQAGRVLKITGLVPGVCRRVLLIAALSVIFLACRESTMLVTGG